MSNWGLKCRECGHSFSFSEIEDTLENYYLPVRPIFPKEGLLRECPVCFSKRVYLSTELFYRAA
jgi:hypothetical protein